MYFSEPKQTMRKRKGHDVNNGKKYFNASIHKVILCLNLSYWNGLINEVDR